MLRKYLFLIIMLFSHIALAKDYSKEFSYKNLPIDPICILESNTAQVVDLDNCSFKNLISIDNFTGHTSYKYHTLKDFIPGSASYELLGISKDSFVVHANFIGGLTSRLNFIKYYKISENKLLTVFSGPSGDRCHGGIFNAKIENDMVYYDMDLTARLFVKYFYSEEKYKEQLEKLNNCAICKFATLHFRDHQLQSVTLTNLHSKIQENQYQQCFNHLHQKQINQNKLNLDIKSAKEFINNFIKRCITNNEYTYHTSKVGRS